MAKDPSDFGSNKVTWTLTVNGKTSTIPASLLPDYEISPLREVAVGNTPPVLRFDPQGASVQGPQGLGVERTTTLANPLTLTAWVTDDGKFTSSSGSRPKNLGDPVRLHWSKYRGPGTVTFAKDRPAVANGSATTTARFSEPGDYVLHLVVNDYSGDGGGGFQCCWTNGEVKVSVKPEAAPSPWPSASAPQPDWRKTSTMLSRRLYFYWLGLDSDREVHVVLELGGQRPHQLDAWGRQDLAHQRHDHLSASISHASVRPHRALL